MKPLLEFFPIVLFFVVYKLYDIYMATEVLMAATILQVVFYWLLFRKVESMHRVTLVLVFMMGGLTLYLHDEQFIKWKLSIIEWLFGGLAGQSIRGK
jgi:intracellular septation protein